MRGSEDAGCFHRLLARSICVLATLTHIPELSFAAAISTTDSTPDPPVCLSLRPKAFGSVYFAKIPVSQSHTLRRRRLARVSLTRAPPSAELLPVCPKSPRPSPPRSISSQKEPRCAAGHFRTTHLYVALPSGAELKDMTAKDKFHRQSHMFQKPFAKSCVGQVSVEASAQSQG